MLQLFLHTLKLTRAIWHGLRFDQSFRALFFLMFSLILGATLFYRHVEGWSVVDALYFSVMTMSTIGFGDLVPTTPLSKIFTIVFSLLSVGVFVAVVGKIVEIILERKKNGRSTFQKIRAAAKRQNDSETSPDPS
jgi:voltage-gated potassium channel Kch